MQCVLKVHVKAYKFARDACIKHMFNERNSVSDELRPFTPTEVCISTSFCFPDPLILDPLDANT